MNWLDVTIFICVALGAYTGLQIGVVCAVSNILGGYVGSLAASRFYLHAAALLFSSFPQASVLGYMTVFISVAGTMVILGIFASQLLERYFLGLADRFMGALLGVILSLVVFTAFLLPLGLGKKPFISRSISGSAIAPLLINATNRYFGVSNADFRKRLEYFVSLSSMEKAKELLKLDMKKE